LKWTDEFSEMLFPLKRELCNVKGAFSLKNSRLPSYIYKYREINENSIKNLQDDTVWLADPSNFNDPYDSAHTADFNAMHKNDSAESLEKYFSDPRFSVDIDVETKKHLLSQEQPFEALSEYFLKDEPEDKKLLIKSMIEKVTNDRYAKLTKENSVGVSSSFKLCSFSEVYNSMLMWAHYADYHKGFCVEYNVSAWEESSFKRRFLYPVIYSNSMFNATDYFSYDNKNNDRNNLYLSQTALIKSKEWEYEKEWRLVFSNGVFETEKSYPIGTAKAVYLGAKIKSEKQDLLVNICNEKNIKLYKMKTSHNTFNLVKSNI